MSTIAFAAAMLNLPTTVTEAMTDIKSPCNNICTVDKVSALCVGCGRTLAEITAWSRYTDDERMRIMTELPQRLIRLHGTGAASAGVI